MPLTFGVVDLYGEEFLVLDVWDKTEVWKFPDEMVDPLRWYKNLYDDHNSMAVTHGPWEAQQHGHSFGSIWLSHVVLAPDLIGEEAWKNKRENVDVKANVLRQPRKFDPKKIPSKISKPREVPLKRVGGKEMIFCEIPKGKFNMSNVEGQAKAYHRVELTRPFWMTKFCVTTDEWREYAPNDFQGRGVHVAEKLFPKNPICVRNPYRRWEAYCDFLNARYGNLLPEGYVFRLPTEAEWEWAFIADEKGDVRKMSHEDFNTQWLRPQFEAMLAKARAPKDLRYDPDGYIGGVYVGGRTARTGFGIYDIAVQGWSDVATLDAYDAQGCVHNDGVLDGNIADPVLQMIYEEKEVDPVVYAGRTASFSVLRKMSSSRRLNHLRHEAFAHIVIAPDILTPLKEKEVASFPKEDFGGVFLGESVTLADISSKGEGWRNTPERLKQMISLKNVIVDAIDKHECTDGFRTKDEDAPWIMLDVGGKRQITGLAIDGFDGHTRGLCIWVSDDGKHEKLVDKEELMRKRYRIDLQKKNVKGRYIRIGREPKAQKGPFFLDKVVIYGKEK